MIMKIVLVLASVLCVSIAAEPLVYNDPATNTEVEVPTLFGIEPNPNQANEEWVLTQDNREVYAPMATFDMRFDNQSVPYVLLHGKPLQKVELDGEHYELRPADISFKIFQTLPIYENKKLRAQSEAYLNERTVLPSTPNLEKMYREEVVENCGKARFFHRNNAKGEFLPPIIKFEKHGSISLLGYAVNKITCTKEGRIILQLGLYTATGGKMDYVMNENNEMVEAWTYRPAVAIIDTGIKAVTH